MEKNILNIYCPSCGAPAQFDIIHQVYACQHCGGMITLEDAKNEKKIKFKKSDKKNQGNYHLETTTCSGCGAKIVFEENEALSSCEFCGRKLVRKSYTEESELPDYVIPFGITLDEAKEKINDWCEKNSRKAEAKYLQSKISQLKGYYLPYEMIRGPVHCTVSKRSEYDKYEADGYLNDEFINCSKQLDNLVLDAMEPFDFDNLKEFDFAYVAGHRVKVSDIGEKEITQRLHDEVDANYRIHFEKMWGTRAINTAITVEEVIRFPVLLPVYYIADGDTKAAVNGQTGKVSVCAEKQGSYLELPWWLKGIMVLLLSLSITFSAIFFSGNSLFDSLYITGALGFVYLIVFLCMLADGGSTEFGIFHYGRVFNSGEQTYHREHGRLVLSDSVLKRRIADPVFKQKFGRKELPVSYVFNSPKRSLFIVTLSLVTIFLPVILSLIINGFHFSWISLGGSTVWFCITLPIVPICFIRFGIQWIYENPWVYTYTEEGRLKRYRKKIDKKQVKKILKDCLISLIKPPICLAIWFAILAFIVTVYLTAFGNKFTYDESLGSANTPAGKTIFVSVFADDSNYSWNFGKEEDRATRERIKGYMGIAADYLTEEVAQYGAEAEFVYDFEEHTDLYYETDLGVDTTVDGAEDAENAMNEFLDEHVDSKELRRKYKADNIVYFMIINTDINNKATTCTRNYYEGMEHPYEIVFLYNIDSGEENPPAVYAHEVMHAFGDPDLYYECDEYNIRSDFLEYVKTDMPNDLMLVCIDIETGDYVYNRISNEISEFDAYYAGLTNHCDLVEKFGLYPSQHVKTESKGESN